MVSNEEIHLQEVDQDLNLKNGDEEDETYKQIKPMHKSYSDPNLLSNNVKKYAYSKEFQLKDFKGVRPNGGHGKKEYSSLYILGPRNRIRVLAKRITESKYPFLYILIIYFFFSCLFTFLYISLCLYIYIISFTFSTSR